MYKSVLRIEGVECWSHHGCMSEETSIGGKFSVDVILELDLQKAIETDELAHTADYVILHNIIKEEMSQPSKLIEHAAGRILKRTSSTFAAAINIIVRVTKFNPPVNGYINRAVIEVALR